jgi:hypothetical protein
MKKNRQRVIWLALLIALLGLTAFAFAASRKLRRPKTTTTNPTTRQNRLSPVAANRGTYVERGSLSPKLVWHLKALGDRLENPGKERLTLTGTLTRSEGSQLEDVVAVLEFPERLRLTIQRGVRTQVITFDREQAGSKGNGRDAGEQALIETLVYGTAEHFFMTQKRGEATRLLGTRFRIDDGSTANYTGPYYDVYKVADQIRSATNQREQETLYYFNSDTLLLERVFYQINREGSTVKVEEITSNWGTEQGQQLPRRIERIENGKSVFVLTVRTASLSPRVNDGVFAN